MGLKITGIRIENFRKFREPFELDLVGPSGSPLDYVVLAGPNGCGKTTILEALLIALRHEEMVDRSRDADGQKGVGGWGSLGVHGKVTLRAEQPSKDGTQTVLIIRTATESLVRTPEAPGSWDPVDTGVPWDHVRRLKVEYFSSRRIPALLGPVEPTTNGQVSGSGESTRLATFKKRLLQQMQRRLPGYTGPEPRDEAWLASLNTFWRAFRNDGTTLSLQLREPENLDANHWDLYVCQGSERIVSADALSSGELEVLTMAVPLIMADFDGLLIIDEPELHLHPEWQFTAMRALRSLVPQAQVMIATHADDPWDDAFSFQRFLLVPDSDPRSAAWREAHATEEEE